MLSLVHSSLLFLAFLGWTFLLIDCLFFALFFFCVLFGSVVFCFCVLSAFACSLAFTFVFSRMDLRAVSLCGLVGLGLFFHCKALHSGMDGWMDGYGFLV